MKTRFVAILTLFLCVNIGYAQVKIGENPDIIDPASLVELESNDKAFILTRVDDVQMSAMAPLNGALVYNTSTQCVHYYDGTQWLNLCDTGTSGYSFSDNGDGTFTLDDGVGGSITWNGAPETVTTLVDNMDGSFSYTNEAGTVVTFTTAGADDQNLTLAGNILSIEDGNNVDLTPYLDNTDDQNLSGASLDASNILQIDIEDGTSTTVDLSSLDDPGTDDQTAVEVTYDNTTSGLTAIDVQAAIDEVSAGSTDDQTLTLAANSLSIEDGNNVDLTSYLDNTDDQNLSGASLDASNILQIDIEDGTSTTVDLSSLDDAGTDDQNISGSGLSGTDLTIGIENGTNETVDLSSLVGTDDQNLSLVTNTLSIEDGNSVDLSGYLDNTDDQNISGSGLSGTDLTISIENGTNETVDLSSLVGTDDQNIESLGVNITTNVLTVGIEDGTSQTVDLSHLDDGGTDDQNLSLVTNTLSIEDGNSVDLSGYLDNTDDQNIESLGVDIGTNILTVGIEDGTSQTVDLSHLDDAGTDDQNISGSGLSGTDLTIGIENGTNETVDLSSLVGTDDQNIESLGVDTGTNILTVGIEDGTSQTVDLSHLDDAGTDDQNITGSGLSGTDLTIGIENGTNETVDLSSLLGTDDQNIESLGVDTGTNILTVGIEDGTSQTVDLSHLDDAGTDNQNIESLGVNITTNVLTVGIEDGTSQTVDLSHLDDAGTDDQNLSLVTNTLSIEDGNSVDLSGYLDNTDDQNIQNLAVDTGTNILTVGIEDGTSQTVDLSHLDDAGTDDQNISGSGLSGTDLTISIENGTNETVDLSSLVGSDDQNIESLGVNITTNVLTVGIEDGTSQTVDLSHLNDAGTDDQNLSLVTNTLSIEDGNSVDLSGYLDNTDDQNIQNLAVDTGTNILTVGIEDGTSQTVDLSHLDDAGTDDQNIESLGVNITTNVLTVGIEDGTSQTVDLSHLDDAGTDDQNIQGLAIDTGTNILTVGIEDGTSQTVDLSHLDAASTDDQTISTSGAAGNISIEDGNTIVLNVDDADADPTNEIQTLSKTGITITLSDGGGSVDETVTTLAQNTGTGVITYTNESGTNQTANVVSTDADNAISAGSDGGAYYGGYEKVVIWAEEAAALTSNTLEWSFGDGSTGQIGIPLPEAWEAYAVSFNADISGAGDTITMAVINAGTNANLFTFTASGTANNIVYTEILATPVNIPAGTAIGFRTVTLVGGVSDARVAVWLRRRP